MPTNLEVFIDKLHDLHRDSSGLEHYAKDQEGKQRSTMPVTPFVYDFFLYNTLYSIDWEKSVSSGQIRNYPARGKGCLSESAKQDRFEGFLKQLAKNYPEVLGDAFYPLAKMSLEGAWTRVEPDAYISIEKGNEFFNNLRALQALVKKSNGLDESQLDQVFDKIKQCRKFVYDVRCNIFHGTKHMGEIWVDEQKKRIEVYRLFLNCLLSAFFTLWQEKMLANNKVHV